MPEEQQRGTESKHHFSRTKKVQHECVVKCIVNREQQRTCQWRSSMERSPSIILPERCIASALSSASSTENNREHASGAAARNGVQASSFQNGQVQHECAVKCITNSEQERTCQKSSSTERSPSIIFPERTSAARVRCQVHNQQRTTENMPMEQQSPSIILQERTSEARMRCQVRHQQRTCQWSISAERSPSIILPERTGSPQVHCQVHHQQ